MRCLVIYALKVESPNGMKRFVLFIAEPVGVPVLYVKASLFIEIQNAKVEKGAECCKL